MKKLLICNWKMNLSYNQAISSAKTIAEIATTLKNSEIWIAPTPIYASEIAKAVSGSSVRVGAQNCHWEEKGAFTGETSPIIAKSAGLSFSLIGHSERRQQFAETDEIVTKRFNGCLNHNILPVLCIGETAEQKKNWDTKKVLLAQLEATVGSDKFKNFIVAYEPAWAIGAGVIPTKDEIEEAHGFIKNWIDEKLGSQNSVRLLYGGSANPENFKEITSVKNVHGGLPGGASLDVAKVAKMADILEELAS